MPENHITEEIKALIGTRNGPVLAFHPVEASEVRRFHQAIMDPARRYWDEEWAKSSRYGGVVAPPAFPPLAVCWWAIPRAKFTIGASPLLLRTTGA